MKRRYSKDPTINKTLHHSLKDAVAFSVMSGSIETYFSAFAIALKANAQQVALIATLPNLIGALAQLFSAWLGHQIGQRKIIIVIGAFSQVITIPFIFAAPFFWPQYAVEMLLVSLTLYYASAHFIAPQWMSLMGEIVPEKRRGRFFARRTALATITSFVALCAAGLTLHLFDLAQKALLGFALLFLIAFIARIISAYNMSQMHEPEKHAAAIEPWLSWKWLKHENLKPALRFSLFFVLMQSAVGISAPFFAVYMLKSLQFSYLQFTATIGIAVLVQFLTLSYWGRISDLLGNRLVLVTTGWVIPILPALWLVSPNFWYLLGIQTISGFCWAGFSLASGNILYEFLPKEKRATYLAMQTVTMTLGVFIGSMVGALVSEILPTQFKLLGISFQLTSAILWAFLISTMLRIVVSAIFLHRIVELRMPRRKVSPYEFIFRVTRFNAFTGMFYEILSRVKKNKRQE